MKSHFKLDLEHKSDAEVRAEGGTLIAKLAGGTFFTSVDTAALATAITNLKTADDNKGTGVGSTDTAAQKRAIVDYEFNAVVSILDTKIASPTVTPEVKILMMDETGLVQSATGRRGKQTFGFLQLSSTTPAFLLAQGIEGGGGIHQWKITKDITNYTGYELLDPTEHARIELTTVLPATNYVAMHRSCKKGIWSDWEGPLSFRTK
jgi:hypothetical protein